MHRILVNLTNYCDGNQLNYTRREFSRDILYNNIAIIAIQHSKMHFVDTFGDFSHTVD